MKEVKIGPSIISGDFADMKSSVKLAQKAGADYIHADVMDGVFVPNITFGMPMIKAIRPYTDLLIDAHLMITEPEKYLKEFAKAGADMISFHISASKKPMESIDIIKGEGKKAGVVINPDEEPVILEKYIPFVDYILLMGVFPGFSGQKFIAGVLPKISAVRKMIDNINPKVLLQLDGGVTESNAKDFIERGVDLLVCGSSFYGSDNPSETIKRIRSYNI